MSSVMITSRQNQRVKDAVKLRDRRQRERQGRTLIDGGQEVSRAIAGGMRIVEAFVCEELLAATGSGGLSEALANLGVDVAAVAPPVFEKLSFGDRLDGIVAVAETPPRPIGSLVVPANSIVAVLEGVEKPGNVGAVARTADATGVSALVLADGRTDLYNPNSIRASLGLLFSLPVAEASAAETLAWLCNAELSIFVARPDADLSHTDADFRGGGAVVLGSEAEGVSAAWHGPLVTPVRLPMLGTADSLNVSVAAAVLFYEALRQRTGEWGDGEMG